MSVYPDALDSDLEIPRVENNITEIGGDVINSLRDIVFAIEKTLGVNPQGNASDLVTRIGAVIDGNGNIRSTALAASGLVSLPITDAQVGTTAAIKESKLDLNYSTSSLNAGISSNSTDIESLITSINSLSSNVIRHYNGNYSRHDGYEVDLRTTIRSATTVEAVINLINNALVQHENSSVDTHTASSVSVLNEFLNISATNVQSALVELDAHGDQATTTHQDQMHTTGIILNDRSVQGTQGNLKDTTFCGTIYQTDTTQATNILQVMRPNVARVSSKNIDLRRLLFGSRQNLRIQAGGVGRGALDVNLTSAIPTDDINDIVEVINTQARQSHYPISAYNTSGKLTIAHNIPGEQFTIRVLNTVSLSADGPLGFSDVASETFTWTGDDNAAYIGGALVGDFKTLVKKHHVHGATSSTISLGLGDLRNYGVDTGNEGRVLCNITNHSSSPSANGTYYIISYTSNEVFILNASIAAGTFDIEIMADSLNFENSSNGELFDIFVEADADGYGILTKHNRITYGPISGVSLKSVSKDFPTSNVEWRVASANKLYLYSDNIAGVGTDIPAGFIGQLRVFAPDNTNSALFEVHGTPTSLKRSMTSRAFSGSDDKLYIGSIHYAGNFGLTALRYFVDKRDIGVSMEDVSEDELNRTDLENTIDEIRSNGVIRGLDVISTSNTSFRIRGGRALVNGRVVDVETQDVTVNDLSDSSKILLLDRYGNFIIKDEYDSGYTLSDLSLGTQYGDDRGLAIICEFATNGTSIDGYFVDRRLMVNNIDKRLDNLEISVDQQIDEVLSTVQGSMWGFTVTSASVLGDGYVAGIEMGANNGFTYVPYADETQYSAYGFGAGDPSITTRRFEFTDQDAIQTSVFRAIGLTHINVFIETTYTGATDGIYGPFGVSGTVYVDVGVSAEVGSTDTHVYEGYANVKVISSGLLPSTSLTEKYVVSIPVDVLELPENVMFDIVPRIRIRNSNYVDGGIGPDPEPTIRFDNIRVVTSSYSIAGSINSTDGSSVSLGVSVDDIL